MTQKQLAERINFHHTVISRAENPRSGYIPTRAFLDTFCGALALCPDEVAQIEAAYADLLARRDAVPAEAPNTPAPQPSPHPTGGLRTDPRRRRWAAAGLACLLLALALPRLAAPLEQVFGRIQFALAPVGSTVFLDDFEHGTPGGWEYLNYGKWEVRDVDGNHVFGVFDPDPAAIPNAFLSRSLAWDDYSVSADVRFESGVFEQIYFVVRNAGRRDNCTGYRVGGNRLGVAIFRFDSNGRCQGETLAETFTTRLTEGHVYHMRVEVEGNQIRLLINNALVLEAEDDRYPRGGIGLLAYEVDWAWFDNLRVKKR